MVATTYLAAAVAAFVSTIAAEQFVMYTPGGDDTVVERVDPILSPGNVSQHVHQVFGSNALSDEVSYESLQQSTCTTMGSASGDGVAQDHSIYWHPALFMEKKDGSGYLRIPTNGHKLYYRDAGNSADVKADPFEFPKGFRMITGNPFLRVANPNVHQQDVTQWVCHSNGGNGFNQGPGGGFPTGVTDCDAYPGFNGAIHFPHCWNGADYDPAHPQAHMAYPDGDISAGPCPSTHPTRLPHIFIENQFDLHSVVDAVKPDSFVLAMGDNTGYGWHADFFNGWEQGAIPALLASCPPNEYGNEDVGLCSALKKTSIPNGKCKLTASFDEEVTSPGAALPGCNPVDDANPAPIYAAAALGVASNGPCALAGAPASYGSHSSASAVSSAASESTSSVVVVSSTAAPSPTVASSSSEEAPPSATSAASSAADTTLPATAASSPAYYDASPPTSTAASEAPSSSSSSTSVAASEPTAAPVASTDGTDLAASIITVTGAVVTVTEVSYATTTKVHHYHHDNSDSSNQKNRLRRHIQRHVKHGF